MNHNDALFSIWQSNRHIYTYINVHASSKESLYGFHVHFVLTSRLLYCFQLHKFCFVHISSFGSSVANHSSDLKKIIAKRIRCFGISIVTLSNQKGRKKMGELKRALLSDEIHKSTEMATLHCFSAKKPTSEDA